MKKLILFSSIILSCFKICHAQPGELDPSFGKNGIVQTDFGLSKTIKSSGRQVLVQPDGTMYVVAFADGLPLVGACLLLQKFFLMAPGIQAMGQIVIPVVIPVR